MSNENKKSTAQELTRWLRIGTLTLTTFGPAIDALVSRLRERRDSEISEAGKVNSNAELQERLLVVGGALRDLVAELSTNPYAQDLLKRGEEMAEELIERGSKLSQTVVERGSDLTHDLAGRSEQATRALSQRGQQMRQELIERSNPQLLVAGFGVGLLAAAAAMYLFIRKRLPKIDLDEDAHIELPIEGLVGGSVVNNSVGEPTAADKQD
jgi:hypothetical protein